MNKDRGITVTFSSDESVLLYFILHDFIARQGANSYLLESFGISAADEGAEIGQAAGILEKIGLKVDVDAVRSKGEINLSPYVCLALARESVGDLCEALKKHIEAMMREGRLIKRVGLNDDDITSKLATLRELFVYLFAISSEDYKEAFSEIDRVEMGFERMADAKTNDNVISLADFARRREEGHDE